MTRAEVAEVMALLADGWPREAWTPGRAEFYFALLADLDKEHVVRAVFEHATEEAWPPTPGEIRRRVLVQRRPDIDEAWVIARSGRCMDGHPEVLAAYNAIGGWGTFEHLTHEQEPTVRAQFVRFYQAVCARSTREAVQRNLPALARAWRPALDGRKP